MPATLCELLIRHGSDKWHTDPTKGHSYGPFYDKLFAPRRHTTHAVLELGVLGGASLRAWRDYFTDCHVTGLDINPQPKDEWMISIHKCDVTKKDELDAVLGNKKFSVGIDDASHWADHQVTSFELLWPRILPGGLWVVEDIQNQESHNRFRDLGFTIHDFRSHRGKFDDVLAVQVKPA